MAVMILSTLFLGVGMVSTVAPCYWTLVSIHRPLEIAILLLVLVRIAMRLGTGAPPLPADLPRWQVWAARASHVEL
jgi:cytochrome b561